MLLLPAKTQTAHDLEIAEIQRIVRAYVRKVKLRQDDPLLAYLTCGPELVIIDHIDILS